MNCCGTVAPVYSCSGAVPGCTGAPRPGAPAPMPKKGNPTPKVQADAPAVILVSLPENAKLTIDGNATTSTSSQRTFISPPLPQGEQFQYTLRAEVVREGRTITETHLVNVRGGEETRVPFNFSSSGVASTR